MRVILLFCILFFGTELCAQRNIFDGFDDNSNEWPLANTSGAVMQISNGQYNVSGTMEGFWSATKNVPGGMDKHFRIEVSVSRDSLTASDKGAGIIWGVKGDSVRYAFLIYGDGHFTFQKVHNTKTQNITPKDIQFAVDAGGYNNLRVERNMEKNTYDFSINEQLVLSTPYGAPGSDEVGLYADVAGSFHFDNFWFIEQADTKEAYRPHALSYSSACTDQQLNYQSDYGYSFCVPFGWRVDEHNEAQCFVWPVGFPYQVNVHYSKLAIEDSFSVAARNDFKIFVDSAQYAYQRNATPLKAIPVSPGVECWTGYFIYNDVNDQMSYTVYRCYVYCKSKGGFVLIETRMLTVEEQANMLFQEVALQIAQSVRWPK